MADALVGGSCVASADASALYWSAVPAALDGGGLTMVQPDGAGGFVLERWESGALVSSVAVPVADFPLCSRGADAADGVGLGFVVLGAWAVAYAVIVMRRALV